MRIDLSVQHVSRTFGDFTAVDDVSFTVEDGRFFSILGPSGCGKTTLLRMIAGFLEPSAGRIEIRGSAKCWANEGVKHVSRAMKVM